MDIAGIFKHFFQLVKTATPRVASIWVSLATCLSAEASA